MLIFAFNLILFLQNTNHVFCKSKDEKVVTYSRYLGNFEPRSENGGYPMGKVYGVNPNKFLVKVCKIFMIQYSILNILHDPIYFMISYFVRIKSTHLGIQLHEQP